jgi:hypothetical protein
VSNNSVRWSHDYIVYHCLIIASIDHMIKLYEQTYDFALSLQWCVLSGEATNTNCIVFGLTRPRLELTIYRTRGEHANHYTTDAVQSWWKMETKMHVIIKIDIFAFIAKKSYFFNFRGGGAGCPLPLPPIRPCVRAKTGWLGIRITCEWLSADCCFSELAL